MHIHPLISTSLITAMLCACSRKENKQGMVTPDTLPEWKQLSELVSFRPLSERKEKQGTRFTRLGKQETGIDFQNHVDGSLPRLPGWTQQALSTGGTLEI